MVVHGHNFFSEPPIMSLPVEVLDDILFGHKRLHQHHHLEVRNSNLWVARQEFVLFCPHYAVLEQLVANQLAILFADKHDGIRVMGLGLQ